MTAAPFWDDLNWSGGCNLRDEGTSPAWREHDMRNLGGSHFLIGIHTPERMGTIYPTRDAHNEGEERQFTSGWHEERQRRLADRESPPGDYG